MTRTLFLLLSACLAVACSQPAAAQHDTMDPMHMQWMAGQFPNGRYLHCPDGSHLAFYDDQQTYMAGLIDFLRDVDRKSKP